MIECENCNHFEVCKIYDEYISKLEDVGLDVSINRCKNYEEYFSKSE